MKSEIEAIRHRNGVRLYVPMRNDFKGKFLPIVDIERDRGNEM
ncbi:hypothetical protein PBN151_0768 [Paenibacillus sp. NAIST15-1]|nr:hypothetical protein PBN151_0768 [Paenibacillus sp. NAIST15-1]